MRFPALYEKTQVNPSPGLLRKVYSGDQHTRFLKKHESSYTSVETS